MKKKTQRTVDFRLRGMATQCERMVVKRLGPNCKTKVFQVSPDVNIIPKYRLEWME